MSCASPNDIVLAPSKVTFGTVITRQRQLSPPSGTRMIQVRASQDAQAERRSSMEFTFTLGSVGLAVLIIGSIAVGVVYHFIGTPNTSYEWLVSSIGAFIGGFIASEWVIGFREFAPVYDGVAIVPALLGGLVVGAVVAASTRMLFSPEMTAEAR
jgi:hypothetical protein